MVTVDLIAIGRALWAFANADSWEMAMRLLEAYEKELLSEPARAMLSELIADLKGSGTTAAAREADYWAIHLRLLDDARQHGVAAVVRAVRREMVRHATPHYCPAPHPRLRHTHRNPPCTPDERR